MPIYTRTGDTGTTSLFGGKRVLKCEELVEVYGSLDELNSWVGLVGSQLKDVEVVNFLHDVQSDLFTIGSMLAGWSPFAKATRDKKVNSIAEGLEVCTEDMEVWIDTMDKKLPELHNFILPGGSLHASYTHLARAVCRRVERQIVALHSHPPADFHLDEATMKDIIKYVNRLSDLLFELARFINKQANVEDIPWKGTTSKKR